ncbi:MAG: universal stress protein [Gammaproteobacteria bacterium]|nr:universal stress protein [Gammaproteobacteria bacterium]
MFKEILLPVDLQQTELSDRAVAIAKDVSGLHDARITVLTVIPDFGMPLVASYFPDDAMREATEEVWAELKRFVAARFDDASAIRTQVLTGSPHKAVLKYAEQYGTDLIVVPARAINVSKVLLGSVSTQIVERAPCSVMVVRP